VIEVGVCDVCTYMNALHIGRSAGRLATSRRDVDAGGRRVAGTSFDWAGQIKLAIVLSIVAAITVTALAGRIAEPVLIVSIIVVASVAAWARVEPVVVPVRSAVRRR
jgi:hypothetical protein